MVSQLNTLSCQPARSVFSETECQMLSVQSSWFLAKNGGGGWKGVGEWHGIQPTVIPAWRVDSVSLTLSGCCSPNASYLTSIARPDHVCLDCNSFSMFAMVDSCEYVCHDLGGRS